MTRLLFTADNHVGKGVHLYAERLQEQEQVWRATLAVARERGVTAVLHGGDLFDSRRPGPDVMLAAERPLVEHVAHGGPPVHLIAGNHDVPTQDGPCGLDVLAEAGLIVLHRRPEVVGAGGLGIVCLPWTPISRLIAARNGSDRDTVYADAADLLVQTARDLREIVDGPAVLLGHWSVSGSTLPTGLPVDQLHDVILPALDMEQVGFERCVYGHIHKAQQFGERSLYVGSPMPLDFSEGNDLHGCWIIDTEEGEPEFVALRSRPFVTLPLEDYEDDWTFEELEGAVVRVKGTIPAGAGIEVDYQHVREVLAHNGAHHVTLAITTERAARPDREPLLDTDHDPVDLLRAWLADDGADADRLADIARTYLAGDRAVVA